MNQMELLKKLMSRNSDAFLEMTEKYSWSVYSLIRSRVSDSKQADALFHKTMDGFYRCLYESKAEDPVEAILFMYAEKMLQENQNPTAISTPQGKKKTSPGKEKGSFFRGLINYLLLAAIAAVLWVIAGLLMDLNLLPGYDLGYEWFNSNIAQWF